MGRNYSATAVDTTLAGAVTSSATSIVVAATTGFPAAPFVLALIDSPGSQEIVQVTGVTGNTLTVVRAYDFTTATAHPGGTLVRHVASAVDFREASLHIDATTGVHGIGAGAAVGTTTTQTLTNKNLTSGTNTFPTFITGYLVPTGAGMEWPSTSAAPAGYLMQDGGQYPIATYTALYNFLTTNGTVFPFGANTNGAGAAGSTHFRTPLRAGRVVVGYNSGDTDFNAIGKTGGAKTHTLSAAELAPHSHGMDSAGVHSHSGATAVADANQGYDYDSVPTAVYDAVPWTVPNAPGGYAGRVMVHTYSGEGMQHNHGIFADGAHTHTIHNAGGGAAHNNLQPFIVMNYIIKT